MYNTKKTKKHTNKPAFIVLGCVILAGLVIFSYQWRHNKKSAVSSGPTAAEIKQSSDIDAANKKQSITSSQTKNTTSGTKGQEPTSSTTSPSSTPPTTPVKIDITSKQESNGTITVSTKLYGISSGSCTLQANNGSKSITQTATVIFQPEFSTCAGFSVPKTALGSGTWNIVITVVKDGVSSSNTSTLGVN
jgi:hypothetical protein